MIQVEQHGPVTAIRMARAFLGRPLAWTNAYWVDGLLVDTGPYCTARELARVLRDNEITQIVVTHAHEDMIGGLAALRAQYPAAKVYASSYALDTLRHPERLDLQWYRRLAWGAPRRIEDVIPLDAVDHYISTADFSFRVVETPGHAREHISLFEPNLRWVFCGDAYMPGQVHTWPRDADLFGVMSSLRTLAGLRPERLFPAHGPVRRTPLPDLHDKIGTFTRLARDVAKLHAAGMSTEEIVARLFRGEPRSPLWTGGHLSVANLVDAVCSYNALLFPERDELSGKKSPALPRTASSGFTEDSADSTDSSANRPADRGDVIR
jgi:glyoxylase-like metal-dependent hydrolase (beta-lactamase superfamily II)